MVLFSRKTHTPLAALTLKAVKDIGCLSMLTGRPAPKESTQPHFQGMLSMPDQNFNLVISNLTDAGMINFNVLHTPHRVSEVDPGRSYGVNEVNELHSSQSYEILADQRTGRTMLLKGKTNENFDPITKQNKIMPVTVDESEAAKDKSKQGLYFYLSVVPDNGSPTLVEKFKEGTIWKASPGFVREVKAPLPRVMGGSHVHDPYGSAAGVQERFRSCSNRGLAMAAAPPGNMTTSRIYEGSARDALRSSDSPVLDTASSNRGAPTNRRSFSFSMPYISPPSLRMYARREVLQPPSLPAEPSSQSANVGASSLLPPVQSMREVQEEDLLCAGEVEEDLEYADFSIDEDSREEYDMYRGCGEIGGKAMAMVADVNVGKTQAGELAYGERINVNSSYTGHEYAYEHASEPTVLCLSIWEDMKFLPLLDTVEKMLEVEVKEWVENEGKVLIESLNAVFKEDKCVIDLESEADTIVCTCGHQCINHTNISSDLRRCPLCRSPITAFVRADGIVM